MKMISRGWGAISCFAIVCFVCARWLEDHRKRVEQTCRKETRPGLGALPEAVLWHLARTSPGLDPATTAALRLACRACRDGVDARAGPRGLIHLGLLRLVASAPSSASTHFEFIDGELRATTSSPSTTEAFLASCSPAVQRDRSAVHIWIIADDETCAAWGRGVLHRMIALSRMSRNIVIPITVSAFHRDTYKRVFEISHGPPFSSFSRVDDE